MKVDSLVIVEKNHLNETCLFVNPVSPTGAVHVHTELEGAWLELGAYRVELKPTEPLLLKAELGRHPITIHARGQKIPLFVHVDVDGDDRVELCVRADDKGMAQAALVSRVARDGREPVAVCFQTSPQGLAARLHVTRKGSAKPDVIDLPKGQPFQTLELPQDDFPVQVRLARQVEPVQVGGTEQVDIIVE